MNVMYSFSSINGTHFIYPEDLFYVGAEKETDEEHPRLLLGLKSKVLFFAMDDNETLKHELTEITRFWNECRNATTLLGPGGYEKQIVVEPVARFVKT